MDNIISEHPRLAKALADLHSFAGNITDSTPCDFKISSNLKCFGTEIRDKETIESLFARLKELVADSEKEGRECAVRARAFFKKLGARILAKRIKITVNGVIMKIGLADLI